MQEQEQEQEQVQVQVQGQEQGQEQEQVRKAPPDPCRGAALRRQGACQGKRPATTASRARRRWTEARIKSPVHRSAALGERSLGAVQRSVGVKKRKGCSIAKRAM